MTSRTLQTIIVVLTQFTTIAATDMFLPSLPSLTLYFGVSDEAVQLAIPLFLTGSFLAAPILGSLSDHFGRKPVMLWGIGLFMFGSVFCIYSTSLPFFLVGRFLQGAGAVVPTVVGWAMIQDIYPKDESAKMISSIGCVVATAPLLAPGIGGYIYAFWGWQGCFVIVFLIALVAVILFLFSKESPRNRSNSQLSFKNSFGAYRVVIKDKTFLIFISFYTILSCGEWCYLTVVPFYFENALHLSPSVFGLYLSGTASFLILGTLISPLLLKTLGFNKTLTVGLGSALLGSFFLLYLSIAHPENMLSIVLSAGLYFLGKAIIWAPTTSKALQRFEDKRGAASAVRGLILMASFAIGGFIGSLLDDSSLVYIAFFLMMTAMTCMLIHRTKIPKLTHCSFKV